MYFGKWRIRIRCLELWNMTKSGGGQFALASPLQILGDESPPPPPWFTPMAMSPVRVKVQFLLRSQTYKHSCVDVCTWWPWYQHIKRTCVLSMIVIFVAMFLLRVNKKLIRRWQIRTWHRSILQPVLRLTPQRRDSPGTIFVKFCTEFNFVRRMAKVHKRLCYSRGTARRATSVEILWPFFDWAIDKKLC